MDLRCACPGLAPPARPVQCESQADGEDGLCSPCRERDCPSTPLSWFVRETEKLIRDPELTMEVHDQRFQQIMDEYLERCREAGDPP